MIGVIETDNVIMLNGEVALIKEQVQQCGPAGKGEQRR